ncbi:DUF2752 domain-containing protein [uncultured Williamsia sp.]|uniref:DUF2752 domain-containing protein n=1 Tax=uncultured Williamsia sp. TaxID=259311 RepID=UPI002635B83E|nr:DUF2752 domain-containing protein [uncultured Williamsia sp.]
MTSAPAEAPPAGERRHASPTAIATVVGGGAVVAAFLIPTSVVGEGPVLCPFRLATGLPCPGCGLTRSWVAAAHGDLSAAFADNLFGPISLAVVMIAVAAVVVLRVVAPTHLDLPARVARSRVLYAVAAVWIVYGVARAVDAAIGTGLFPAVT